jgi:hypothetical protein
MRKKRRKGREEGRRGGGRKEGREDTQRILPKRIKWILRGSDVRSASIGTRQDISVASEGHRDNRVIC